MNVTGASLSLNYTKRKKHCL